MKISDKEFKVQLALGSLTDKMKYDLADNLNTPTEILTILSTDKDKYIRGRVAYNTNTSKEVLTILSKDKHWNVRYRVAENPSTPKEILTILSTDKDRYVRSNATTKR